MTQAETARRSRGRIGCIVAVVSVGLIAATALAIVAVALRQMRATVPELHGLEWESTPSSSAQRPARIRLEIESAQLVVVPAPAGEPLSVTAEYDPSYFALDRDVVEQPGWRRVDRLRFGPTHSAALALLRIKLGQPPPVVRVRLPRDLALELEADIRSTFAAVELGGLYVSGFDMTVTGGAATVSFLEPSPVPMEHFVMRGDKGSVEVTGLGQASPRIVDLRQRFGQLDLDLRGPWARDAEIRLDARFAGGGVWLPADVVIEGLDDRLGLWSDDDEDGRPRLRIVDSSRSGRLLFARE